MILFINACVRNQSRTKRLAERVLSKADGSVEEICLDQIAFPVVDEAFLAKRDKLIALGSFDHEMFALARQFAMADEIVIAAPFWDLSFPATLKQYLEQINVLGITFTWKDGVPNGLCKAQKLTYVTTSGGDFFPEEYGFGYVKALAQNFYGIRDVRLVKATGLDMDENNPEEIVQSVLDTIGAE